MGKKEEMTDGEKGQQGKEIKPPSLNSRSGSATASVFINREVFLKQMFAREQSFEGTYASF